MAVQLNHDRKNIIKVSDVFQHQYEPDFLIKMTDTLFGVPDETKSSLLFLDEQFKPYRIHLTTALHKSRHESDYELIAEHRGKTETLFICFALKKNKIPELTFPLEKCPLESLLNRSRDCLYYKTSTKNHVFFCTDIIPVGDDFPTVLDNAKKKYKEIFEPYTFESNQNIITQQDTKPRVIETLLVRPNLKEGFETYMECDLITDDNPGHNTKMSEYALTPLRANTYERGMVNFIHFLHFILIVGAGGIILPYVQCNLKPESTSINTWVTSFHWFHWIAFLISIILLIVGLSTKKSKKINKGRRRTIAMFGLYIMILFISNIVGMAIQFPASNLYDKNNTEEDAYGMRRIITPMFKHLTG